MIDSSIDTNTDAVIDTNVTLSQPTKSDEQSSGDEEISMRVFRRLSSCGYPELSRIFIRVENGTVFLEGKVHSYYLKQLARVLVISLENVEDVCNAVDVVR